MFSWLEGLVSSIASSIGGVFEGIGDTIVNAIWDNLVKWLFNAFYDSIADVFTQMGDMGAEIFDLSWIEAAVQIGRASCRERECVAVLAEAWIGCNARIHRERWPGMDIR